MKIVRMIKWYDIITINIQQIAITKPRYGQHITELLYFKNTLGKVQFWPWIIINLPNSIIIMSFFSQMYFIKLEQCIEKNIIKKLAAHGSNYKLVVLNHHKSVISRLLYTCFFFGYWPIRIYFTYAIFSAHRIDCIVYSILYSCLFWISYVAHHIYLTPGIPLPHPPPSCSIS